MIANEKTNCPRSNEVDVSIFRCQTVRVQQWEKPIPVIKGHDMKNMKQFNWYHRHEQTATTEL